MFSPLLSKYEHQFELELVNEAVEGETDDLKRLKNRHRKSWGVPTPKPSQAEKRKKKKRIKSVEDKLRAATAQDESLLETADEVEPNRTGKVWMTRRRVDGKVSLQAEQPFMYGNWYSNSQESRYF